MMKQPAENTNASADEEQAEKRRVIPEPQITAEDEHEISRVAQAIHGNAVGPEEYNHARNVVLARKKATCHA